MNKQTLQFCIFGLSTALLGCSSALNGHSAHTSHSSKSVASPAQPTPSQRPKNQAAVLTVWAEASKINETIIFYKEVLGLKTVGDNSNILDADGTFIIVMEGKLEQPKQTQRRWPLFALSTEDLKQTIQSLEQSKVDLPWGIEEFGSPEPSSRYVMFYDPAGNLIEIVQWL